MRQLSSWHVDFARRRRAATDFAGTPSLSERARMLRGCAGETKCGFMAASGYDAIRKKATSLSAHCEVVVLTAIFGGKDKLQQPEAVPDELRGCYFAVVDPPTAAFLVATAPRAVKRAAAKDAGVLSSERVGAWRLLTLNLASSPYPQPRRASRVPKLLPFRLFPRANFSIWVDGKLKLLVPPMKLVSRFLIAPRAPLALARNLRRDHIDEEVRWIRAALGDQPHKLGASDAAAVEAQWSFYEKEQQAQRQEQEQAHDRSDRSGGAVAAGDAPWTSGTACAEGAMVLMDLRSGLARCVMCAWFNEWHRFGERDQLALSYVLLAMGLTPPPADAADADGSPAAGAAGERSAHRGVYLWPRREHWNWKPKRVRGEKANEKAKKLARRSERYVRYAGHGGCVDSSKGGASKAQLPPECGLLRAFPAA